MKLYRGVVEIHLAGKKGVKPYFGTKLLNT